MQVHFSGVENADFWVRYVLTMPALFIVVGSPIAGYIVDRFGRKHLLVIASVIYGIAGIAGFFLDSLTAILASRALLGLAVAGVTISTTTLVADYYQGGKRVAFLGLQAGFIGIGGVLFFSLGGFAAQINWRFPFLFYLYGWLIVPGITRFLPEPRRRLSKEKKYEEAPAAPLSLYFLAFIYGCAFLSQVAFYFIPVQIPFYLKTLGSVQEARSGLALAFTTLCSAFASISFRQIRKRLSFIVLLALSLGFMGSAYIGLALSDSYRVVLLSLIPAGVGLGLLIPNLTVWISQILPKSIRGKLIGGLSAFFFLGQFVSPFVSQMMSKIVGLEETYRLAGVGLIAISSIIFMFQEQLSHTASCGVAKQQQ